MREIGTAVALSVVLMLVVYGVLSPFLPRDAAQLATGVVAAGPILADYVKRQQTVRSIRIKPQAVFAAANISWPVAATYGVLLVVGIPNLIGAIVSLIEFPSLAIIGVTDPVVLAQATANACVFPVAAAYLMTGRLFARCGSQRWLAVLITVIVAPLILRIIDYVIIPWSFFHAAFPLYQRNLHYFALSIAFTMPWLAIFLPIGTWWYGRRRYRIQVSALMRFLPTETQGAVVDLVSSEIQAGELLRRVKPTS